MIRGTPVSFNKEVFPLITEYLTENNVENSDKIINLLVQKPDLVKNIFPEVVRYFCIKFNIFILKQLPEQNGLNILKTILYYE